jgi:hypothetical protein
MVPLEYFRCPDDGHKDLFIIAQVASISGWVHDGIIYSIAAKKSIIIILIY